MNRLKGVVAIAAFVAILAGCISRQDAASNAHNQTSSPASPLATTIDPASNCQRAATNRSLPPTTVYQACIDAYRALLNSREAQPAKDEDAVTAAVLELYAAYALDRAAGHKHVRGEHVRDAKARRLVSDAGNLLSSLTYNGASPDVRKRASHARLCLIDIDSACLDEWAAVQ